MRDKSPGIFIMALFGFTGLIILALGWLWPVLQPERVVATVTGSVGLLIALLQVLVLRRSPGRAGDERVPVKVRVGDKA